MANIWELSFYRLLDLGDPVRLGGVVPDLEFRARLQ